MDIKRISDIILPISAVLVMWSLVHRGMDSAWSGHLRTDCGTYQSRAAEFLDDNSWNNLTNNEYQPGALWVFVGVGVIDRALGGRVDFVGALVGLNAVLLLAHVALARWFCGRGHGWVMLGLVAGMGPLLLYRFEAAVSLLVISSVLASRGGLFSSTAGAGCLLGVALASKLYPLILAPGLAGYALRKFGRTAALGAVFGGCLGAAVPTLALTASGSEMKALVDSVRYHFDKPVGVDGFWGSVFPILQWMTGTPLKMASRNAIHGFDPVLPGVSEGLLQALTWAWVPACAAIILATILLRGGRFAYGPGAVFATMGTYVAFAKLSTPQYIWWALPLLALVPRKWFSEGEKIALFAALAICLTLGQLVFPLHYSEFLSGFHRGSHLEGWLFWANAAKNFSWAVVALIGVSALFRNLLRKTHGSLIFGRPSNRIPANHEKHHGITPDPSTNFDDHASLQRLQPTTHKSSTKAGGVEGGTSRGGAGGSP